MKLKTLIFALLLTGLSFGQVIYKSIFDFPVITDTASSATKSTFWTIFYGETLGPYRLNWQTLKAGFLTGSDSTAFRTYSNVLYQSIGLYLVPSDSTAIRNASDLYYSSIDIFNGTKVTANIIVVGDSTSGVTWDKLK